MHTLRPELKELPLRMAELPVDKRGYPCPWFIDWIDDEPEFRAMSAAKWIQAVKEKLCWVCGKRLGAYLTFVLGPMCGITGTTSEPPCHRECARWSAINCPFLARPHMDRRQNEQFMAEHGAKSMGGVGIKRNPGVALLWITRDYEVWSPAKGERLIRIGEAIEVEWWAEGRPATRAEVQESIRTGLPYLEELARQQEGAMEKRVAEFDRFLPGE